ncbi:MAG TPA: PKD domain-containing protein [Solirubrobacterales bacterium]
MPSRFLVSAFVCSLTLAAAAPAGATTYCAAPASGCGGGDYPTLTAALGAASASPTADVVQLGAAGYADGPWSYVGSETNPVTIRGTGDRESQLLPSVSGPNLTLTYGNLDGVLLYSPQEGTALRITLGTLSNSQVVVTNFGLGVAAIGATVEDSAITPSNKAVGTRAVLADQSTVEDTLISTTDGVEAVNPPVTVRRATIVTQGYALQSGLTQTKISDSVIVLDDPTAVGVQGICDIATGTITIEATNLTVTALGGGIAFRSTGAQLCGGLVEVSSSLVDGVGTTAACAPGGEGGKASVAFEYSAADLTGAGKVTGTCTGPVDAGDNFLADPKLASPGSLRPVPRFDSPLVDAGDPASPDIAQQPTDLAGLPRAVNGRRDIGALEYGRRAPLLTVAPELASVKTGEAVAFTATVSDPDLGDTVVVTWSFDDGGTGTGNEVGHSFATAGSHSVTATATDSAGVTAVRTVPVEVVGPDLPSVEKPKRAEPPVTIGLKGPKKVRRGKPANFRFGSSKPGGTFMCRVDKKPWKPCGSPFKVKTTKLGPARKHRFSVYAVDSGGTADATPLSRSFLINRSAPPARG